MYFFLHQACVWRNRQYTRWKQGNILNLNFINFIFWYTSRVNMKVLQLLIKPLIKHYLRHAMYILLHFLRLILIINLEQPSYIIKYSGILWSVCQLWNRVCQVFTPYSSYIYCSETLIITHQGNDLCTSTFIKNIDS